MSSIESADAQTSISPPPSLSRRAARVNLMTVGGAHAVIHATVVLMPLVYPILHAQYGFSFTEIGLLVSIPSFVSGLLQLLFGYLGRYVARKALIGIGNLVVGVSMFLTGLATTFPSFMSWSVLRSIGGSPQHPVGSSLLSDSFPRERRGFALAAHVAGGNLGTLLVPFIGTALIVHFGWQPTLMLFALPGLVAGTAVLLFAHEPAAVKALPAPATPTASAEHTASGQQKALDTFFAPLRHRAILLIIAASVVAAGGRGVGILTTYLPLYLANGLRLDARTVAGLFTVLLIGSVVGPLVAGRISDRTGRKPMLLLAYGLAALFTVLLPLLGAGHVPPWALVVEIALLGLSAYAESPLLQAFLADHAPDAERDAAFGWYFTLAFGIGAIWGAVLGALIDATHGFQIPFWVMAGSYLAAAAILLWVPRTSRARAIL